MGRLEEYGWLAPGDPVYLEDTEMAFSGVVLVSGVGLEDSECRVTLLILDDAARLRRARRDDESLNFDG